MIELPDIVSKIKETKSKEIKRYPCHVNRASGIGYAVASLDGCLRRGVYERTHWQEKELWSVDSIMRLAEGNHQEKIVLRDLDDAGFEVIEQQTMFEWKKYNITGHIDGKILVDGVAIPIEIKSMSPFIFEGVHSLVDFRKYTWTTAYLAQIQMYMLMQNIDQAIFVLKDKSSGLIKQINVELDYDLAEDCVKAAEMINQHIANETIPERVTDIEKCKGCPFKMTCLPDTAWGQELKIEDDPEFEARLDRYFEIKGYKTEAIKLWEIIKSRAKASKENGGINLVVGKYRITGKENAKGSFTTTVKAL